MIDPTSFAIGAVVAWAVWAFVQFVLPKLFSPEAMNRTVVYMRSMKTPAQHWEAAIHYDEWGSPYVKGFGSGPSYGAKSILPNGQTSDTYLYGTEWKHKSGPEVVFPSDKPQRPFDTRTL